jgi:hypothetical protein
MRVAGACGIVAFHELESRGANCIEGFGNRRDVWKAVSLFDINESDDARVCGVHTSSTWDASNRSCLHHDYSSCTRGR